jgi:carboxymethylenebutenolidase
MTAETITLNTEDNHELQAYVARPEGTAKGGLIILQEIFGVTDHIKEVADGFAAEGYLAVAPAMFDRIKPGIVLDYSDFATARETMDALDLEQSVLDMKAAADYARSAGKVGIVGFCWGGSMADLAACNSLVDVGISYYGRMTVEWLDKQPTCPMLYHYGETDQLIPSQIIEKIQRARKGKVYVWGSADHGFNCKDRPQYHKTAATGAMEATLKFLNEHIAS